jgi:hypothetical protein
MYARRIHSVLISGPWALKASSQLSQPWECYLPHSFGVCVVFSSMGFNSFLLLMSDSLWSYLQNPTLSTEKVVRVSYPSYQKKKSIWNYGQTHSLKLYRFKTLFYEQNPLECLGDGSLYVCHLRFLWIPSLEGILCVTLYVQWKADLIP